MVIMVTLWLLSTTKNLNSKIKNKQNKKAKTEKHKGCGKVTLLQIDLIGHIQVSTGGGAAASEVLVLGPCWGKKKDKREKKHTHTHTAVFSGRKDKTSKFGVCVCIFFQTGCCDFNFLSAAAPHPSWLLVSPLIFDFRLSALEESWIYIYKKNDIAFLCLRLFFVTTPVCWAVCRLFHLNIFFFLRAAAAASLAHPLSRLPHF